MRGELTAHPAPAGNTAGHTEVFIISRLYFFGGFLITSLPLLHPARGGFFEDVFTPADTPPIL